MKVITIKQPYAYLIQKKIKTIETRSWKTNYRGELYIQAGKKSIDKSVKKRKELASLYNDTELEYGAIICKCKLIDCIYMDEIYINKIKKNEYNNYISGRYEVGRYAWVLDEIEVLKESIPVKGQLGIWNYNK